jgi:NADH-quinone oxidoreductase subunit D
MPEIKVPMGPQHPALKEPSSFTLTIDHETVVDIDVNIGYNHRGIEKACEKQNYVQNIYLLERVCGICSMSHATNYAMGVEELMGIVAPRRAQFIRVIVAELERLHSHFLWLGVAGHMVGYETLFMLSWRDREIVQDLSEAMTGNRVNYGINTIGGVRRDVSKEQLDSLSQGLIKLREQANYYIGVATSEPTLAARAVGVAPLAKDIAISTGAVGPLARASGVARDVRKDDPYLIYGEIPFSVITHEGCDIFSRVVVRALEILESIKILEWCVANIPAGDLAVKPPRKIPVGEAVVRYEAPRGEDIHYYRSNGSEFLDRVKVRAPTMANWLGCMEMCRGQKLADIPIAIASIDPCYSCTDRIIQIEDLNNGRVTTQSFEQLRQYGIRWYK